ncbi:DNA polymerase III subunit gamma/tau [Pasteurella testudinis]|uniref:DNA polymerase III subunit gamma/tau n=1 Tax=Pasteurella testudinis TaxID=761 RepID=UPI0040581BB2
MSYQVLARKWRPQRFSQVVGQEHVLTALANGLESNRLHHAYLFSGTRGVGKTSIARLFAKGLNCEHGVTAEPCGECENCRAIEEGRFIDLLEIDAASRTKVEDTRELLDNVQYKPVQGRYKIYLIDEVHMLSRHSFNALLKTLEEPPEYVKFLLATTDPHKLPITILSRCIQFHLKALEPVQIADHLEVILQQEHIPYQRNALDQIAKAAKGSIRDSLSLTDQAIAMSKGNITAEIVHQMLGTLDSEQALDIIQALQLADGEAIMKAVRQVAEKGVEWDQLLQEIATHLHQIAMRQLLKPSADTEDRIDFLARNLPPEDVQYYYQLMLAGRKELPYAPDQRSGVEMTMLRALAFHPKLLHWEKSAEQHSPQDSAGNHSKIKNSAENARQHVDQLRQTLNQAETAPQQTTLQRTVEQRAVEQRTAEQLTTAQPPLTAQQSAVAESATATAQLIMPQANQFERLGSLAENPEISVAEIGVVDPAAEQVEAAAIAATAELQITAMASARTANAETASTENAATGESAALKALRARDKLRQTTQKKSPKLTPQPSSASQNDKAETALADNRSMPLKEKSLEIMERLNRISTDQQSAVSNRNKHVQTPIQAEPLPSADELKDDDDSEAISDVIGEDYHWQWSNPELEQTADNRLRPSDIKQAILQERTPELVAKVLKLSAERDHWSDMIEKLSVSGMVKQLGLNSLLLQEDDNRQDEKVVVLGLRPEQSNLNNERYIKPLAQQLSEFYQRQVRLEIQIEADRSRLTPLEQRRQVYLELGEQAKQALQHDPQLALLQQEFDAVLDLDSIRAVG